MNPEIVRVCRLLNERGIAYLIIGAYACALHGHVRATNDIDLLVQKSDENLKKVLDFLAVLYPHLQIEMTPQEIRDEFVIKILDEPELDISIKAWQIEFEDAIKSAQSVQIEGVEIPYIGLDDLISSKSTVREIDQWDLKVLRNIKARGK